MSASNRKKIIFSLLISVLAIITVFSAVIACANVVGKNADKTQISVYIHDKPFFMSDKEVQHLYITVKRIDMVNCAENEITTIFEGSKELDILQIEANNPVLLSTVPVAPGAYDQIRLILGDESTIVVDGETHPLTIPSGFKTGVKIVGNIFVPAGKLFKMVLDFDAEKSVIYSNGQGYKLKPVIHLTDTVEIVGIYRGTISLNDNYYEKETLVELREDSTFRLKYSDYPNYEIYGNYYYDSLLQKIKLTDINLSAPGLGFWKLRRFLRQLPDEISFDVIQWSLDDLIIIDIYDTQCQLYKIDAFSFSENAKHTDVEITVNYNHTNNYAEDMVLVIEMLPMSEYALPKLLMYQFTGSTIKNISIPNYNFYNGVATYKITGYITREESFFFDYQPYNSEGSFLLSGTRYQEVTDNPWQNNDTTFDLTINTYNKITISFPRKLNISCTKTSDYPEGRIISWDEYPNAPNGYLVLVLCKDNVVETFNGVEDIAYDDDGSNMWDVDFVDHTLNNFIIYESSNFILNPDSLTEEEKIEYAPNILSNSDIIRIEVYVVDETGKIDTKEKKGVIVMDYKSILGGEL